MDESGYTVRDARHARCPIATSFFTLHCIKQFCASADNAGMPKTPVTLPTAPPLTHIKTPAYYATLACVAASSLASKAQNSLFLVRRHWRYAPCRAPHTVTSHTEKAAGTDFPHARHRLAVSSNVDIAANAPAARLVDAFQMRE